MTNSQIEPTVLWLVLLIWAFALICIVRVWRSRLVLWRKLLWTLILGIPVLGPLIYALFPIADRTYQRETPFAIVRIDFPYYEDAPGAAISVVQIVSSQRVAAAEVDRLSYVNADESCWYMGFPTRVYPPGTCGRDEGEDC